MGLDKFDKSNNSNWTIKLVQLFFLFRLDPDQINWNSILIGFDIIFTYFKPEPNQLYIYFFLFF